MSAPKKNQAPDHSDPINPIDYAAWESVKVAWTDHAYFHIYDFHKRQEVISAAVEIFCRRHRRIRTGVDKSKATNIANIKHVAQLSRWSISDAARELHFEKVLTEAGRADRRHDRSLGVEKADTAYEDVDYFAYDEFADSASANRVYQSPSDKAAEDSADAIMAFAKTQSDQRFAQICELLMDGYQQNEIAEILEMGISTVCELIAKNRDLLLAQMQLAKGGC